ncbi:MAG: type 1 glutamine amidotransferase [Rhodospirillaceae bacterium]|jgi:GMP synthase-like glutamine amidotransferase|nr:type 1 glutamine amidotransferase [Rhodospirillaceae bacterium]MBT6118279.1 type 1 glutamine amidotransferase [Rhodospirillaceae bacterium]
MRFLVFQHIDVEHPGILRDFMAADGIAWDAVELDAGEEIPPLDGYDALVVMGGPMDVWQENEHPWLVAEKAAVREAVAERGMPYLGICLGHQLLAEALGGEVGPMGGAEVGVLPVAVTEEGRADPLFQDFAERFLCLQWHGAAVTRPPPGATVLAGSPVCANQAMRVGANAYGFQYHVEVTEQTVGDWAAIPEYERSLRETLGADGLDRFKDDMETALPQFNAAARRLYDSFKALVKES